MESPNTYVSESAQRQLDALRSSVDVRLAALEAALNDPAQGDALERLILELARTAAEEAQAAAAKACIDMRLEADMRLAQARTAAQIALDEERAHSEQLRVSLEETRQRLLELEREQHTALASARAALDAELLSARQTMESELTRERARTTELGRARTELERAAAEADAQLASERARTTELRSALDRADERLVAARADLATATSAQRQAEEDLVRERSAAAEQDRAHNETRAALAVERNALAESRRAATRAAEQLTVLGRRESETRGAHDQLAVDYERAAAALRRADAELVAERQTSANLRRELTAAQARVESEEGASEPLRRTIAEAEARVASAEARTAAAEARAVKAESGERTANADLQRTIDEANRRLSELLHDQTRTQAGRQDVQEALALARVEIQGLRDDLEAARARVEVLAGERGDMERLWKDAESQLKFAIRERDEALGTVSAQSARMADLVQGEKDSRAQPPPVPLDVLPSPAYKVPHKPGSAKAAKSKPVPADGWQSVRLYPRYAFKERIDVQINGGEAILCDLSVGGCQLLSTAALKPNQPVKILLPSEPRAISCTGKIVWAKLEASTPGRPSGYRAGVEFSKASESAIDAFIAAHAHAAVVE